MPPQQLRILAEELARERISPLAQETDRDCLWPEAQLKTLCEAGLMGLHVPRRLGGLEQGLQALVLVIETLAKSCPSTSMCYGMHCVGTAVLAAKATPYHEERFLKPIAHGRHITSLSLSESGTGSNFYIPETRSHRQSDHYTVDGRKSFVTSGGRADSYVLSGKVGAEGESGEFTCLILPGKSNPS